MDESLEENQGLNLSLSSILHGNNSSENGVASKSRCPSWINRLARVAMVTHRFATVLVTSGDSTNSECSSSWSV